MYNQTPQRSQSSVYQPTYQTPMGGNGLYPRRAGNSKVLTLSASSDEFTYGQDYTHQQQMPPLYIQPTVSEKKKPIILEESNQKYTGRLKFFDENKNYGFIIMDEDGSDIFVHYDDLSKAGITKELLRTAKLGNVIKLTFNCMKYVGKYDKSRKATDVQLIS